MTPLDWARDKGETPDVREVMERAFADEYVPPNKRKSKDEERFVIRELAREYLVR